MSVSSPEPERSRGRTLDGRPLTPGVNVDEVSIGAGVREARAIGYGDNWFDETVVVYALQRHARGEETGAEATFLGHFGKAHFTGWRRILATAVAHA